MTEKTDRKRRMLLALILAVSVLSTVTVCYADVDAASGTALLQKFSTAYNILVGIGLAGAIISLAIAGIQYLTGNETQAAKARTAAIYILIAVAAMYLIPKVLSMGVSLGKVHAWNPESAA